jgi:hypothetical protein
LPEFEEDRCVRQGHVRFDNQDVIGLRRFVDRADHAAVEGSPGQRLGGKLIKQTGEQLAKRTDSGSVLFRHMFQFEIGVGNRSHRHLPQFSLLASSSFAWIVSGLLKKCFHTSSDVRDGKIVEGG